MRVLGKFGAGWLVLASALAACGGGGKASSSSTAGSAGSGGAGGGAGGGSAGSATSGAGSGGLAGAGASQAGSGQGGAAQAGSGGAGGAGGCQILKDGETGPHGLTRVYTTTNAGDAIFPAGFDGDQIYFETKGMLWAYPVAGGTAKALGPLYADHELVQGGTLYAISALDTDPQRHIFSATLDKLATPTTVATGIDNPFLFIADDTSLYFDHRNDFAIFQVPLAGSKVTTLVPGGRPAGGMVSRGGYLYWVDSTSQMLERVPVAGGPREPLVPASDGGGMVADDQSVYFVNVETGSVERYDQGATQTKRLLKAGNIASGPERLALVGDTIFCLLGPFCGEVLQVKTDGTGEAPFTHGIDGAQWIGATATSVFVLGNDGLYRADR